MGKSQSAVHIPKSVDSTCPKTLTFFLDLPHVFMFSEFLLPVQTGPEKCFLLHIQPLSPYPEVFNLLLTPCHFLIWLFLSLSLFLILFLISRTNRVSSSLSFSFFFCTIVNPSWIIYFGIIFLFRHSLTSLPCPILS